MDLKGLACCLDGSARTAGRFKREAKLLAERLEESVVASSASEDEDDVDVDEEAEEPRPEDVARVLRTWRELDWVSPPAEPLAGPAEYVLPRPAHAALDKPLGEIALDGLTPLLVQRLIELGTPTLRSLVGAEALELVRQSGLSFTRVKRLQFFARRECERLAAAERALPQGGASNQLEAAGPFA